MNEFRLVVVGQAPRTIRSETADPKLADIVSQLSLYAFEFKINGETVPATDWATTVIPNGATVWGTMPVKGA